MGKEKSIGMRLLQTAPFRGNGSSIVMTCRYPLVGRCFYGIKRRKRPPQISHTENRGGLFALRKR